MEGKTNDFFWPGYVDLLTALFAAILVLFVLSFKLFRDHERKLGKEQPGAVKSKDQADSAKIKIALELREFNRAKQIETQIRALDRQGTFIYDSAYKRFLVRDFVGQEIFTSGKAIIKEVYRPSALSAGHQIVTLISPFRSDPAISFLILVEGNTAKKNDGLAKGSIDGNYSLSYKRALALVEFWKGNGIDFGSNTELIIAGSGIYGVGRDTTEDNNKRFLIQVIPKIRKL